MVTPQQLVARRPEFRSASNDMIAAAIQEASNSLAPDVLGPDKIDRAINLKACDILARSPFGLSQRLVSDDGTTIYSKELEELADEVAVRMIVI